MGKLGIDKNDECFLASNNFKKIAKDQIFYVEDACAYTDKRFA